MAAATVDIDDRLKIAGGPKLLAEDLYAVEASFAMLPGIVVPLRMTIIRLPESRDLVVYSPLDPGLVDISELGEVKAVVAPNSIHWLFAHKFVEAHVGAQLYSSPALPQRFPDKEWGTVIEASCDADIISPHTPVKLISGLKTLQELVVLHKQSGSLIAADLAFNLPASERAKMSRAARWYIIASRGTRPLDWSVTIKLLARSGCKAAEAELDEVVEQWEWERFVPCHGAVVGHDAKQVFRDGVYAYVKRVAHADGVGCGWWFAAGAAALLGVIVAVWWTRYGR